jgi:hypothetical protein
VTDSRVTQYPQTDKGEVIIPMMEIIYFSRDSLLTGMSKNHNNLKLCYLSQGAVKVIALLHL